MANPLLHLPLNSKRSYVMAATPRGCEIYMPVDNNDSDVMNQARDELQTHLNLSYPIDPTPKLLA